MKNRTKRQVLYFLTACMLFSLPPHARAETTGETTGETKARIEFTEGEGPTYPVNPEDPGTDITTESSVEGSLAIVTVSDFNFGSIRVTGGTGLFNITTVQPNIQVVDLRGTGSGWSVNASVTGFTSGTPAVPSLPGARIHIYNGRPNSVASLTYAPTQLTNRVLPTDSTEVKVITAAAGTGTGLWVMRWYPPAAETTAYVQLEVPAGAATLGTHTATINWTLGNTP